MSRPCTVVPGGGPGVGPYVILEQRSPAWFAARAGLLTGSVAADVFATVKTKGAEAAARRDLRTRLVCERLLGRSLDDDGFVSKDMQRGIDREADALATYEAETGQLLTHVGFLRHPTLAVGCSPDGMVGEFEGIVETKCPRPANHLRYLRAPGTVPAEHLVQCQHALFVSGAAWVDFVSYCPEFPEPLALHVVRLAREAVDLAAYELVVRLFLDEVEGELAAVRGLIPGVSEGGHAARPAQARRSAVAHWGTVLRPEEP